MSIDLSVLRHPVFLVPALTVAGLVLVQLLFDKVLRRLAGTTASDIDDRILGFVRKPVMVSVVVAGVWNAAERLSGPSGVPPLWARGLLVTTLLIYWSLAVSRVSALLLDRLSTRTGRGLVQPRTLPLFQIAAKALVAGSAIYFFFVGWGLDLTGWLASAGIVGIAVGFAARDTLANLFAGIFILADAPYRLGDYLVLSSGERGRVTEIGIRSTRILTHDDIEIIVPNSMIANSTIVNETGGPHPAERVRCTVSVAYGSDIDRVRELLLEIARDCDGLVEAPEPRVRFREMADSGLVFQLLGWIRDPSARGRVLDALNSQVYKRFQAEGIEIPYPKRDLYLREAPAARSGPADQEDGSSG